MEQESGSLLANLINLSDTKDSLRLCYQSFLANYLLAHGYLEPASFFSRFTTIPFPIVIPDSYRIAVNNSKKQITEIKCNNG